jgi:protein-arginine kinase activator protein McsA
VKILTNMMNWFAAPEREMYEEAAEMRDGLQKLNK